MLIESRAKKILLLLVALAAFLGILLTAVLYATSSMRSEQGSAQSIPEDEFLLRPAMAGLIPLIFNMEDESVVYDWVVVESETGVEELVETSSFEIDGQDYEFLLSSLKANPVDKDFAISDYLTLTIDATTANGVTNQIVYIDLGADGGLDSAYLNDVVVSGAVAEAEVQNQYTLELMVARDYLLGY